MRGTKCVPGWLWRAPLLPRRLEPGQDHPPCRLCLLRRVRHGSQPRLCGGGKLAACLLACWARLQGSGRLGVPLGTLDAAARGWPPQRAPPACSHAQRAPFAVVMLRRWLRRLPRRTAASFWCATSAAAWTRRVRRGGSRGCAGVCLRSVLVPPPAAADVLFHAAGVQACMTLDTSMQGVPTGAVSLGTARAQPAVGRPALLAR